MGLGIDLGRLATMVALVSCGASSESAKAAPSSALATAGPSSPPSSASTALPPSSAGEPAVVASAAASAPTPDPYAQVAPLIPGTARSEPPPPPEDPEQKACPTNLRRPTSYSAASGAWAKVQRGWSKTRLLHEIGGPASCDRSQWSYVAGPYSGPELTYRFTFQGDVVVGIGSSTVGCRDF